MKKTAGKKIKNSTELNSIAKPYTFYNHFIMSVWVLQEWIPASKIHRRRPWHTHTESSVKEVFYSFFNLMNWMKTWLVIQGIVNMEWRWTWIIERFQMGTDLNAKKMVLAIFF
jgi:hypothetical protein